MKHNLILASAIALVITAAVHAQIATSDSAMTGAHYSRSQLHRLKSEAHTPQQYQALGEYFQNRQQSFQKQADAEKQEWARLSENVSGPAAKYPRPVDSAKNLCQYYLYEADQMGALAAQYHRLAEGTPGELHPM